MSLLPQSGISQPLQAGKSGNSSHGRKDQCPFAFQLAKVSLKTLFKRQGDKNHNLKNIDVSVVLDEVLRHVQNVGVWDTGDYQCQVNTQTRERLDVELVVRGEQRQLSTLYGCY